MDLQLVKKGLDFSWRKKKFLLLLAACSFTSYAMYRAYHLPLVAEKRKKVLKPLGSLISVVEAISDSVETIGVVSRDLKDFLQSDSDKIPKSLKQISKITSSKEFSGTVVNVTQALTVGILRGYRFHSRSRSDDCVNASSSFMDQVMDKLFTPAGSGFASAVVGSFARNLIMAFYSNVQSIKEFDSNSPTSSSIEHVGSEKNSVTKWVNMVCGNNKCRELIGDCVQLFVSTAVAVYLDKTMNINTYDEFFAGLTNPKHQTEVKDVLVAVSNGAIETLVKTSHQVLTSSKSSSESPLLTSSKSISDSPSVVIEMGPSAIRNKTSGNDALSTELRVRTSFGETKNRGWIGKVSSTLAVPSNRRFVLDLTGKVTFETVRSVLEILLEKICDVLKRTSDVVCEAVVDSCVEVVRCVTAKSSAIATMCLSLCWHMLDSVWILVPA